LETLGTGIGNKGISLGKGVLQAKKRSESGGLGFLNRHFLTTGILITFCFLQHRMSVPITNCNQLVGYQSTDTTELLRFLSEAHFSSSLELSGATIMDACTESFPTEKSADSNKRTFSATKTASKAHSRKQIARNQLKEQILLAQLGSGTFPTMSRKRKAQQLFVFPSFDKCDSLVFFPSSFARCVNSYDMKELGKLFASH
jgi:hypothetical protein